MAVGTIMGNVINISVAALNIDPQSVAAQTGVEQFFTLTNARLGDFIEVAPTQFVAGLIFGPCRVTANGTVGMAITNVTLAPIDTPTQQFRFLIARPESGQIVKPLIAD